MDKNLLETDQLSDNNTYEEGKPDIETKAVVKRQPQRNRSDSSPDCECDQLCCLSLYCLFKSFSRN